MGIRLRVSGVPEISVCRSKPVVEEQGWPVFATLDMTS